MSDVTLRIVEKIETTATVTREEYQQLGWDELIELVRDRGHDTGHGDFRGLYIGGRELQEGDPRS